MSADFLISEEAAQAQIDLFCDWYGIDLDETRAVVADTETPKAVDFVLRKLVKAFRQGLLEVQERSLDDGGQTLVLIQKFKIQPKGSSVTEIVYHEATGASRANVKTAKNMSKTAEMYHGLAALSHENVKLFYNLRGADIGITEAIGFLFLQI